ncbi:MAG: protease inhibitor I42 family protein [Acidimicrobiales bacterium]
MTTGPATTRRPGGATTVPGTQPAGGTVTVTVTGDTSVDATTGQTIELEVASNPTTGYTWSSEVAGSVKSEGNRIRSRRPTPSPAPAAPGRFVCRAQEAGTATITLTSKQAGGGTGEVHLQGHGERSVNRRLRPGPTPDLVP